MNKLRVWLQRLMYGRYGTDALNTFLLVVALLIDLISVLCRINWLTLFADGILFFAIYRMFSKNINKRALENRKFTEMSLPMHRTVVALQKSTKDKEHRYFVCPQCSQIVRTPKGRGKITITCPHCHKSFDRKS